MELLRAPALLLWAHVLGASGAPSTGAERFLEVSPGRPVVLGCKVPDHTDLRNLTLAWTRPDLGRSSVFLVRDGRPDLEHQHSQFKGRVELVDPTLRSGDLSVRLSDVSPRDGGLYECHASNGARSRRRSSGHASNGARSRRRSLGHVHHVLLIVRRPEAYSVQVPSRSDVLLRCSAPDGVDLQDVTLLWKRADLNQSVLLFRDGRPMTVDQHRRFKDRVKLADPTLRSGDLSIKLPDVGRLDSGQYECLVFNRTHAWLPRTVTNLTVLGPEPRRIRVSPGEDVVLRLDKPDFPVTSFVWKREDDSQHFVFLLGMGHPHRQSPQYSGRTQLRDQNQTQDQLRDLSVILRRVQPSDSGTYHAHIIQSQHKWDLDQSEPSSVIVLEVSSGTLRVGAGAAVMAAIFISLFLI